MTTSQKLDETLQVTADVAEEQGYSYLAEFLRKVSSNNWYDYESSPDKQFANALFSEFSRSARVAEGLSEDLDEALSVAAFEHFQQFELTNPWDDDRPRNFIEDYGDGPQLVHELTTGGVISIAQIVEYLSSEHQVMLADLLEVDVDDLFEED